MQIHKAPEDSYEFDVVKQEFWITIPGPRRSMEKVTGKTISELKANVKKSEESTASLEAGTEVRPDEK